MNCKKCGAMIEIGTSFCKNCGTPVMGTYDNNRKTADAGNSGGIGPLICGIIALIIDCFACLFFPIGIVSVVLGVFGIVYGEKGYRKNGSSLARTGKILSIIAMALLAICVIIGIIFFGLALSETYYESLPWYERW